MTNLELQHKLISYTIGNSNFEKHRSYISMSHLHLSVEELMEQYKNGFPDSVPIKLKCYKGYQMETDMMKRVQFILNGTVEPFQVGPELTLRGGLFKGHPEFIWNNIIGDCKSLLMDEWIPEDFRKVSRRIKYQMNGYMLAAESYESWVVYESRESGNIRVVKLIRDKRILADIEDKMNKIEGLIKRAA